MQSKADACSGVKNASIAGYVTGAFVAMAALIRSHEIGTLQWAGFVDAGVMVALSFLLARKISRVSALGLLIYSALLTAGQYYSTRNALTLIFGLVLAFYFVNGIRGAFFLRGRKAGIKGGN